MDKDSKDPGSDENFTLRGVGMLLSVGITMVVTTVMGLAIGVYLDRYFDTAPWLMLLFLMMGIAAGIRNVYHTIQRYGITDD